MGKEILKLSSPIKVNGVEIKELAYDIDALGPGDIMQADKNRMKVTSGMVSQTVAELDTTLHLYVGLQAVIKLNPSVDVSDLNNLSGKDTYKIMKIGRSFFREDSSVDESTTSEEQSAPIQEDTIAQNSK